MLKSAYFNLFLILLTTFFYGTTANDDSEEPMDKIVKRHDKESAHNQEKSLNFQLSIKKEINYHDPKPSHSYHHEKDDHYQSSITNYHNSNEHHDYSSNGHSSSTNHYDDKIKPEIPIVHNHNTHIHAVNVHVNSHPSQVENYSDVKNITHHSEYKPPKEHIVEAYSSDVKNITENEFSSVYKPEKHEHSEHYEHDDSEECHHDSSSEEHHEPYVKIEHQVHVPIIQTHHHIEVPVIKKEHYLSHLHEKLSALKEHHHQYLHGKKELLHSLHHQHHHTKQIGLQIAAPSVSVQYGAHGSHEYNHSPLSSYSHFSAGFKSAGDLPPQIFPASEYHKDEDSEEHSMRKKRSVKGKLDDAIFEHIMTEYLKHGTPLHIHEHGTSSSTAGLHKRQLEYQVMMPHYVYHHHHHLHQSPVRRTYSRNVPRPVKYKTKKPQRKIDFHLGIPALNLILHISPMLSNKTSSFSIKPTEPPKMLNHRGESKTILTNTPFSQLSEPAHGLFLNSSRHSLVNQYQVHEETNVSRSAEEVSHAEKPSIINFLIPLKKQDEQKKTKTSEMAAYDTELTHSDEASGRDIKEEVSETAQHISIRGSMDSTTELDETILKPEIRNDPYEESKIEIDVEENQNPSELDEENTTLSSDIEGRNKNEDLEDSEISSGANERNNIEEESSDARDMMDSTTEQNGLVETEIENPEEDSPSTNDYEEVESETSTDESVPEVEENTESSDSEEVRTNSTQEDDLLRESRLIAPNRLEVLDELPKSMSAKKRSDILVEDLDSQDALSPVIPIIIHDLREGRVSEEDKKILSQVFGERWANIEMRANKESVNVDMDPQRVDRALNVTEESKPKRNKRSSDYIDVLTDYFQERQKEEEEYAYEDDGEWEEGPDVSELVKVAQAHKEWKTHKDPRHK